jgi:hypothetical protein
MDMRTSLPVLAMVALSTSAGFAPGRGVFERTIKVSEPIDLDVLSEIGGVILTVGASDSIRVQAVLTTQFGPLDLAKATARIRALEANPPIEQRGNRVRIGYPADPELLTRISMRLTIEVPPTTDVRARTGSGGIQISGITGHVDGESGSGRISTSDIDGEVSVKSQSGGIYINKSKGRVVAQNSSGAIEAIDVAGPIDATTGSGAIRLTQVQPAAIRARARSGAIKVNLAPGAGYDFLARSESGKIYIPGITTTQQGESIHHLTGKLGDGGPMVDISTNSSAVHINH